MRGFLAFRHKDNINFKEILKLSIGDYSYTDLELWSLKRALADEYQDDEAGKCVASQWRRFRRTWSQLKRLSRQEALLVVMCMFAAITQ